MSTTAAPAPTATATEQRTCPRCKETYPADAEHFYQNPKTGAFGYCRGEDTNKCNQALDRAYRERRAEAAKRAAGTVVKSSHNKQTGTLIEVARVEEEGAKAVYVVRCVDHGTSDRYATRKEATAASSTPTDWCEKCRAQLQDTEEES